MHSHSAKTPKNGDISRRLTIAKSLVMLIVSHLLAGCAGVHNPKDPLEPINRGIYRFNDAVDKAVIKPVAKGYSAVMPTTG